MGTLLTIFNIGVWGLVSIILIIKFIQSVRIVPTRYEFIVERLGKYHATLGAGFHALLPFVDKVVYQRDLKEETIDVPPQDCFTKDNVKVEIDGVAYISVTDSGKASYGITDYRKGAIQLAQTTARSIIGTLDLDETFEERARINSTVVAALTEAGETWGINCHRFEIKNIAPPHTVKESMEKQVTAERERRALVAKSEGDKQSRINRSEGLKMELINRSEGEMQRRINEAEGKAQEILEISKATAESIEKISSSINVNGGKMAVRLQLCEKFIESLKKLATEDTKVILPANLLSLEDMLKDVGLSRKD